MIKNEIGDNQGDASAYENPATVFCSLGQYTNDEEYLQKALVIKKEIDDKKEEASDYETLGTFFCLFVNIPRLKNIFRKH